MMNLSVYNSRMKIEYLKSLDKVLVAASMRKSTIISYSRAVFRTLRTVPLHTEWVALSNCGFDPVEILRE